jgi:pilus assembly protein CpaB
MGKRLVTDVVLQNVRVLAMDLNADPTSTHPAAPKTATLEVDMQGAEKLALASQAGTLSLVLRRTGSGEISAVRPVTVSQLGPVGGAPAYAPVPIRRGPPPPPRETHESVGGSSVTVVSGDKSEAVKVPSERYGA